MSKSIIKKFRVCLFISVKTDEGDYDNGVLYFDTYSVDKLNAVMDVVKEITLDVIKENRAKHVNYDDEYTWYNTTEYSLIRVLDCVSLR